MTPPSITDLHEAYGRWLELPDDNPHELFDVALAVVIANRMDGDPLWAFLVGPPSSSKTEVIRSLDAAPDVFPLSSLTAQTFASGFERKGVETSLLPKLDGKVVTMKDFGTVLTMYREKKAEILAQLREIYDGAFTKEFGNGKSFKWAGKVGLLAGVTPVIDREYAVNQILGERFVLYRVRGPEAHQLALRAIGQRQREGDQRRILRHLVADFLATVPPAPPPTMSPRVVEAIASLAEFTALARSPVFFDQRGDLELAPPPEAPGRLAKQFATLAEALALVRAERDVGRASFLTVYQVAQDSMPAQRRVMLEALLSLTVERLDAPTTINLAEVTRYPTGTTRRYLQELAAVGLADRLPAERAGLADRWQPSERLRTLLVAMQGPMDHSSKVRRSEVSE